MPTMPFDDGVDDEVDDMVDDDVIDDDVIDYDMDVSDEDVFEYDVIVHIAKPILKKGLIVISEKMFRSVHTDWEWEDFQKWGRFQNPILLRIGKGDVQIERRYFLWCEYVRWFRGKRP